MYKVVIYNNLPNTLRVTAQVSLACGNSVSSSKYSSLLPSCAAQHQFFVYWPARAERSLRVSGLPLLVGVRRSHHLGSPSLHLLDVVGGHSRSEHKMWHHYWSKILKKISILNICEWKFLVLLYSYIIFIRFFWITKSFNIIKEKISTYRVINSS